MFRIVGNASEIDESERFCRSCQKPLTGKVAWLELDQRVDAYHDLGGVPENESQGWFPFGKDCAKRLKDIAQAKLYIVLNNKVNGDT